MNMQDFLARLLISTSLLGAMPVPSYAQNLEASAYTAAVMNLSSSGVIDGGGNVRLNDFVNRAEALKIILKSQDRFSVSLQNMASSLPVNPLFPDVSQKEWYAPYVEVGFTYGLVKGYPDGRFFPDGGVKVAEAAAMLVRSYGVKPQEFQTSADLPNQMSEWYTDSLSVLLEKNAIQVGSRLRPDAFMTRGQLFDIVYRMRLAKGAVVPIANVPSTASQQLSVQRTSGSLSEFASTKDFSVTIPTLGIVDLTISHPEDPFTEEGILAPLQKGVGHLFSYPGQGGKIMVYGHSSGFPWDLSKYSKIFRTINETKIGDLVYVTYKGTLYVYRISEKKTILAKDTAEFEPDEGGEQLVLYTCWPPDSITNRYLVYAVPVETVAIR
jgi:LPXTG-site transpeptidase (sortase) family protein